MPVLNIITLVLLAVGGVNWGLVGVANFDLVAAIFGDGSALARIVYIVVALSAVHQLSTLVRGQTAPAH